MAKKRYIQCLGDEAIMGYIFSDNSKAALLRLYTDEKGIFQMQFLKATGMAYGFLSDCPELIGLLKHGIIGIPIKHMAELLGELGFVILT